MSVTYAADDPKVTALPLVLRQEHLAELLDCSTRTVQRRLRSHQLPEPLFDEARPRWSRDQILQWLAGGSMRRGRR